MKYQRPGFEIEAGFGGAIAMLLIPEDVSEAIRHWGMNQINDDEIYGQDGKGRDGSPHITLQNGIMCEDSAEIDRLFSQLPVMEAELGQISVFRNDEKDYDVVHIQVKSDELISANAMIADLLEIDTPYDYSPHITLAYVKSGKGNRFEGLKDFEGQKIQLGKLAIDGPNIETRMLDLLPREQEDLIPGGKADGLGEADFDPKELKKGADHELEHTKNIEIAREIAMDHLAEDPDYYKRLEQVEAKKKVKNREKYGEPLKESLDYGASRKAYLAEDVEDHLLSNGRSINSLKPGELDSIIVALGKDLKE